MLNALSSTLKSESDDQSRNAAPRIPSAAAFDWIARTARRIEATDVLGNVRWSSRTKNEPASARFTRPSTDSERKRSGTNDRSAKYASIAARCVPRSAKNFEPTPRSSSPSRRLLSPEAGTTPEYAQRHGRSPGTRRPYRDLLAGRRRRDPRRGRLDHGDDRRGHTARGALRRRRRPPGRAGERARKS